MSCLNSFPLMECTRNCNFHNCTISGILCKHCVFCGNLVHASCCLHPTACSKCFRFFRVSKQHNFHMLDERVMFSCVYGRVMTGLHVPMDVSWLVCMCLWTCHDSSACVYGRVMTGLHVSMELVYICVWTCHQWLFSRISVLQSKAVWCMIGDKICCYWWSEHGWLNSVATLLILIPMYDSVTWRVMGKLYVAVSLFQLKEWRFLSFCVFRLRRTTPRLYATRFTLHNNGRISRNRACANCNHSCATCRMT